MSNYSQLVASAKANRRKRVFSDEFLLFEQLNRERNDLSLWASELDVVNKHITIDQDTIDGAIESYQELAEHLVEKLHWSPDDIKVFPQGSSSTQTLINTPGRDNFDIDAVCQVDISRVDANDPMAFYQKIGDALDKYDPDAKRRCWTINFSGRKYYIEFTPSVPLSTVPRTVVESFKLQASAKDYEDTALAVVDTPSESWKTSNPEGFTNWVSAQTEKSLLRLSFSDSRNYSLNSSISPVPEQSISLSDTLRVAIRLFKRHRDMAVRRGFIVKEAKPISVIIVTLLTQCYEGLSDLGATYDEPIFLLMELAELLPGMIEIRDGEYWVANPTVEGENFAEKWNDDHGQRKQSFDNWCSLLVIDLQRIMKEQDESAIRKRMREVFGYSAASTPPPRGLAPQKPTIVPQPPAKTGLA